MLHIHYSNQLETLAEAYTGVLNTPLSHPFKKEQVIVQNAGMARWLSLQAAKRNGISINIEYLFPAEFMWQLLRQVLPEVPPKDPCSPSIMKWRLLDHFYTQTPIHDAINHYLNDDLAQSSWQLAKAISDVFDQYLFFRPDWIQQWEHEEVPDWANWQGQLWKTLIGEKQLPHWVNLQANFLEHFNSTQALPERISFFSIPVLSQGYLRLLNEVAQKTDIHLYVFNPCQVYWGDIESIKTLSKMHKDERLYTDTGNELLASLGTQGRDYIDALLELEPERINDHFQEIIVTSRLKSIQHDILNLQLANQAHTHLPIDQSIQIHACHSPMREVEVLYDQLLFALESNAELLPDDIIIMMPAIEDYAPYIDAVFSNAAYKLPFNLADQAATSLQTSLQWIVKALQLPEQNYPSENIVELLHHADIQKQFQLTEAELERCQYWIAKTNIRQTIGEYATDEHSWQQGLERLLLGYALPSENLYADILPSPDIEGSLLETFSHFTYFLESLFTLNNWQTEEHTLSHWLEKFKNWLQLFFEQSDSFPSILQLLDKASTDSASIENLETSKLPYPLFQQILIDYLQAPQNDSFINQGITFCTLVPMRSVPFKFIGLIGLNDASFPRKDNKNSFNLMLKQGRRRGDRSKRNEDRYLFLESIMAAREQLYISYVGQNIRDNSIIPPSMVVGELLDYLQTKFGNPIDELITRHPLQAFSPRYFNQQEEDKLISYQSVYADHLNQQQKSALKEERLFISKTLPETDESKRISLNQLIQFFSNPSRYFVNHVLNIKTQDYDIELLTREPFALESFVDRKIRSLIFNTLNNQGNTEHVHTVCRAKGLLPHGNLGDLLFNEQRQITEHFFQQLPTFEPLPAENFLLALGNIELYGKLNHLSSIGLMHIEMGKPWIKQQITARLMHLVFNTLTFDAVPKKSYIHSPEETLEIPANHHAKTQLEALVQYYLKGQTSPTPFAPKSGLEYALIDDRDKALHSAKTKWQGNNYIAGEKDTLENQLLFANKNPIDTEDFQMISKLIFSQ
jgi:exodeoxyribonuclease V gamma subunit